MTEDVKPASPDDDLFVSDEVKLREITMGDGTKRALWFKELPQVEFSVYQEAVRSEDESVRSLSVAKLIAMSLVEPTGERRFSVEKASMLKPKLANEIVGAIMDVNGFGSKEKKD